MGLPTGGPLHQAERLAAGAARGGGPQPSAIAPHLQGGDPHRTARDGAASPEARPRTEPLHWVAGARSYAHVAACASPKPSAAATALAAAGKDQVDKPICNAGSQAEEVVGQTTYSAAGQGRRRVVNLHRVQVSAEVLVGGGRQAVSAGEGRLDVAGRQQRQHGLQSLSPQRLAAENNEGANISHPEAPSAVTSTAAAVAVAAALGGGERGSGTKGSPAQAGAAGLAEARKAWPAGQ